MRFFEIDDTVEIKATLSDPSGGHVRSPDETSRFFVFEGASDTPILQGNLIERTGFPGLLRQSLILATASGFADGNEYVVYGSGLVNGVTGFGILKDFVIGDIYDANITQVSGTDLQANKVQDFHAPPSGIANSVWEESQSSHIVAGTFGGAIQDFYFSDVAYTKNVSDDTDDITASWYKNNNPLTSGDLADPALTVIKSSDGTKLVDSQTMDFVDNTRALVEFTSTSIVPSGEPILIEVSGTIDGANRTWKKIEGLDWY